ncbi:MAG: hypothetical protein ACYDBH_03050 [Acidobacteriaceae bacterium]
MCTFERLEDGGKTCVDVIGWRGRLDDCGGWPAPADLESMIEESPECLDWHGDAEDRRILGHLIGLKDYLARHCAEVLVE